MGTVSKTVTIAAFAAGAAATSQFPEFAQQYHQRIGGAVDELTVVVGDFDTDAAQSGMDRDGALLSLGKSPEQLPRDRAVSMQRTIARHESLVRQQAALETADELTLPVQVLRYPDLQVITGAWETFRPAVPLTAAGGIWALIGGVGAAIVARIPIGLTRRLRRRRKDKQPDIGAEAVSEASATEAVAVKTDVSPARSQPQQNPPPDEATIAPDRATAMNLDQKLIGEIGANGKIVRLKPD